MSELTISAVGRLRHYQDGAVLITGKVTLDGSGDATAGTLVGRGIVSIAKVATGRYRVTLQDAFPGGLLWAQATLRKGSAAGHNGQLYTDTVTTTKTVEFLFVEDAAAAPTITSTSSAPATTTTASNLSEGAADSGIVSNPTTPSAQASGTGNTTWSVNVARALARVKRSSSATDGCDIAAAADFSIHAGSYLTGFANGTSCIAAIVLANNAGTTTCVAVKGTPATTGTQVAPTDGEITTGVGHANWIKICETTINRTGDTTVTQAHDNAKRDHVKVTSTCSSTTAAPTITSTSTAPAVSSSASTPLSAILTVAILVDATVST